MEPTDELNALAYRVIGVAIEVHRILGPGYLESVYEEALVVELGLLGIACDRQTPIDETWRGEAEVEEPSVATALAGEAAKALVMEWTPTP